MLIKIYKALLTNGFTSKGQDVKNNKRLGIINSFSDSVGRYIEIYKEDWGYRLIVYGTGFMNGYHPSVFDITGSEDILRLKKIFFQKIKSSNGN